MLGVSLGLPCTFSQRLRAKSRTSPREHRPIHTFVPAWLTHTRNSRATLPREHRAWHTQAVRLTACWNLGLGCSAQLQLRAGRARRQQGGTGSRAQLEVVIFRLRVIIAFVVCVLAPPCSNCRDAADERVELRNASSLPRFPHLPCPAPPACSARDCSPRYGSAAVPATGVPAAGIPAAGVPGGSGGRLPAADVCGEPAGSRCCAADGCGAPVRQDAVPHVLPLLPRRHHDQRVSLAARVEGDAVAALRAACALWLRVSSALTPSSVLRAPRPRPCPAA